MPIGLICLVLLTGYTTLLCEEWHLFETGPFTVSLPSTLHEDSTHGFDSYVVEFTNQNMTVGLNYGSRSGRPLDELGRKAGYVVHGQSVDGREAQIASLNISPGSSNCYSYAALISFRGLKLTMFANCKTQNDYDTVIKIFESVRFRQAPKSFDGTEADFSAYPGEERYQIEMLHSNAPASEIFIVISSQPYPYKPLYVFSNGGANCDGTRWVLPGTNLTKLRSAICELPARSQSPPVERLVVASFHEGTNWVTRSYDIDALPKAMAKVLDAAMPGHEH